MPERQPFGPAQEQVKERPDLGPKDRGILPLELLFHVEYRLPEQGKKAFSNYVDLLISTSQGELVGPPDFSNIRNFSPRDIINAPLKKNEKPLDLTEKEVIEVFKLGCYTEGATESYAKVFYGSGEKHGVLGLKRFTKEKWVPDELQHYWPDKRVLMAFGFSEEEIDREIREAREAHYNHDSHQSPAHLTTFGVTQESFTDNFHRLTANIIKPVSPEDAENIFRVQRRERLHTIWYKDMTAIQVNFFPPLAKHVAEAIAGFSMPANNLTPGLKEIQDKSQGLVLRMGGNFDKIKEQMALHLFGAVGDSQRRLGLVLPEALSIVNSKNGKKQPLIDAVKYLLHTTGGLGAGVIGDAALRSVGLTHKESKTTRLNRVPRLPREGLVVLLSNHLKGMQMGF